MFNELRYSENRAVYEIMWKNVAEPDTCTTDNNIIRHMRFAYQISKAIDTHSEYVDCVLKCVGTSAETIFRLSAKRTSPFKSPGGVSSVDYWQASFAHQPAGFVLLVQVCVLQSCDAYWLPTPFSCFPFTSPPVRHRVPSHFNWTLTLIAFPRQQWLRARTSILCYTYTVLF